MKIIYILSLFLSVTLCKDGDDDCLIKDKDNKVLFDLNKLVKKEGAYELKVPADPDHEDPEMSFKLNICNKINDSKAKVGEPELVAAIVTKGDKSYSLGKINKKLYIKGEHVMLDYEEGDNCDIDLHRMSSRLIFTCLENSDETKIQFLGDYSQCQYNFEIQTKLACSGSAPSNNSSSSGSIIWSILTFGIAGYLLIGILYNRFVKNKQGLEQIPNYQFWYESFDFIKDMSIIILAKIVYTFKHLFNRNNNNNYTHLNSNEQAIMVTDDDEI